MAEPTIQEKRCSACRTHKPLIEFYRNRAQPDGFDNQCKVCHKAHIQKNRERDRATKNRCYQNKKAEYDKRAREWRARNINRKREIARAYYHRYIESNRQKAKEKSRRDKHKRAEYFLGYYAENKDKLYNKLQMWRQQNREKFLLQAARRRALEAGARGCFTPTGLRQKCEYFGWRCYLCHKVLNLKTLTIEHRIPLSRGGANWLSNIAPACLSCNSKKGALTENEYRAKAYCPE